MSLELAGQTLYGGYTHSGIHAGPWEMPVQIEGWFGVKGEGHIVGQSQGRDLTCDVDAIGYATEASLITAVSVIQNLPNTPLIGTLVITYPSSSTASFPFTTFMRLDERDEPQFDAADGTWWQPLTFVWRQAR